MNRAMAFVNGIGLGAGLEYLWDPKLGDQRRAQIRESVNDTLKQTNATITSTVSDIRERTRSYAGELKSSLADFQARMRTEKLNRMIERLNTGPEQWSPAGRWVGGLAGAWLLTFGIERRGLTGTIAGAAGLGLLARSVSNLPINKILRSSTGRGATEIESILTVAAPVNRVYDLWSRYENFPRLMPNIREVRDLGGGRSHWIANGSDGTPVEWDAVITQQIPNQLLAWKPAPSSPVGHRAVIQFHSNPDGTTQIEIRLPENALAPGGGSQYRADPEGTIGAILDRIRSFIETELSVPQAANG